MKSNLFIGLLFCISFTFLNAQSTWIGAGANTNWNTTDNWDTNLVPTVADDVTIPTGFTVTLNVAGSIKSIDIQGNSTFEMNTNLTFTEPSTFGINTTVNWASGTLNGTSSTLTNLGTINLTTTSIKIISGNTILDNQGTFNITSSGDLRVVGSGSILNNPIGGIIDMQADSGNITWSGTPGVINNVGLIKKTTSTGEAQIIIPINNNDGTIQVEMGILSFQNSTGKNFNDGTYNVFAGATMDWDTTINPSGSLEGTMVGNLNWNGILNIPVSETAAFNFSAAENFNWTTGTLTGGGTLINSNVLKLTTASSKIISGDTTLDNQGTLMLTSSGDLLVIGSGSVLNNPIGGIIDMQADSGNITWSGTPGVINNVGLIKKTTSTGEAQIILPINNNDGTIQVEMGILSFQNTLGKNFNDGTYNVFAGATMDWDTTINPSGSLEGTMVGNLNWNSNLNIPVGETAAFNFSAAENFNWTTGTLTGGGTLVNSNVLKLTTASSKIISGDTTLDNQGTLMLTSSGDLFLLGGGTVLNNPIGGIIDIQANSANITWSGTPGVLNNVGLIKKTTSTGEAQIIIPINNNDGTIQVEVGILSFQNPTGKNFNDGTYNVFAGATMDWDTTINPSGSLEGTITGNLNWNSIVNVVIGTFAAFNFSAAENFNWTIGTLSGGGTLTNTNVLKLTTASSKIISGDTTLDNQGTLMFISLGDLFLLGGGTVLNNLIGGIIDIRENSANITWSGTSGTINNAGLLKKTTSTGVAQIFVILNNSGAIEVESGELEIANSNPFTNEVTGIVKGIGIFDLPPVTNFTNNGTFAPGLSPGTLSVQGDYKSTVNSVLDVELDGLIQDTEYDLLAITGTNVVFEGDVNISLGFDANAGDTFTIATVSGTITTANLNTPIILQKDGKEYVFDVTYPGNNSVLLTISSKTDIEVPTVITQDITIQLDVTGNVSITENQIDDGSFDNCTTVGNLLYSLDISTFTCSDLGDNTVILTVTDEAGNSDTGTATVTVEDNIIPTVITQDITVQLDASGTVVITANDVDNGSFDNCSITRSIDISSFTCADVGDHTVTLTVEDGSLNSDSATAIVTVETPLSTFASGSWDVVPHAGSSVLFQDSFSTSSNGDVTACSCEIKLGNTVTVNVAGFLNISENIIVDGILNVEHEGSIVQANDLATVTNNGSITVTKTTPFLDTADFMILGNPMTMESTTGVYGNAKKVLNHITANFIPNGAVGGGTENFVDDNNNNWAIHSGLLNQAEGYLVKPQSVGTPTGVFDLDYTLGTLNNGVVNYNLLFNTTREDSPNMLGNPYASAIDNDLFLAANPLLDAIYYWQHITPPSNAFPGFNQLNYNLGDISVYNQGSGGVAAPNGGGIPSQFMASGQGFGVKALGAGTVTFNNSMRVTGPNTDYRSPENNDRQRIWLDLNNETYGLKSNILIAFTENATDGFENKFDSKRFDTPVSLFSILADETELSIQGRSAFNIDQEVQLGFKTYVEEQQSYTISIRQIEGEALESTHVFLEDRLLHTVTNLSEENYTFISNATQQNDRFVLLFQEKVLGVTQNSIESIVVYPVPATNNITIANPQGLELKTASIYDLFGRVIQTINLSEINTQKIIDITKLATANYLLIIEGEQGKITKRIIKE